MTARSPFSARLRAFTKGFTMNARSLRRVIAVAASSALLAGAGLLAAAPASAHASIQLYGGTATAGGYGALWMRIPHGCDGSPTKRVTITVPASFESAKPQMIGGWKATVTLKKNGTRHITWTATGSPLPDDQFVDFGISVKWPAKEGLAKLPTVQHCVKGKVAWIGDEVPTVEVGPASGGGH